MNRIFFFDCTSRATIDVTLRNSESAQSDDSHDFKHTLTCNLNQSSST